MDNIVESLFGLTPFQVQQQQNAGLNQAADHYASQDPFQRATGGMFRAGGMLGGAGAQAMGMVNPQMEQAKLTEAMMASGGDLSTSQGLMAKSQQFAAAGDQRTALKLALAGKAKEKEEQAMLIARQKEALAERKQDFNENETLDEKKAKRLQDAEIARTGRIEKVGLSAGSMKQVYFDKQTQQQFIIGADGKPELYTNAIHEKPDGGSSSGKTPTLGNINAALRRQDAELAPITKAQSVKREIEGLISSGSPAATPQIQALLTHYMNVSRATNQQYGDNKSFGNIYDRTANAVSRFLAGDQSDANKQMVLKMLRDMDETVLNPARQNIVKRHKKVFEIMGVDPELANNENPYAATPYAVPPAPTGGAKVWNPSSGKWEIGK